MTKEREEREQGRRERGVKEERERGVREGDRDRYKTFLFGFASRFISDFRENCLK